MEISDKSIIEALQKYGFTPDPKACERIRLYISLLIHWNERISLTAITAPSDILAVHFGESIFAVSAGVVSTGRLADVGSGAGFPGIPLSLADSSIQVTLIEPNLRKSVFLLEVKRALGLGNIEVIRERMEGVDRSFDFISARALGRTPAFLRFARAHLVPSGRVILWMGQDDARALVASEHQWLWSAPVLLPDSKRRCILAGCLSPLH
jgi:16S rRNA (guanine527-N7)-methyltransferase